ncbi:unnamed protein product [Vicia faba]|uniref:Amino acid transporter transmembrane domain-containing protein n=1 Tax=Vicia faba TaxID=3906 RepID=A0AAV0YUN0_VICFA|nr:unnamed protein product [Vicia faba]
MAETKEIKSPPVSCPPSQLQYSPSLTRSPLLHSENEDTPHPKNKTPRMPFTPPRFNLTPLASPMRKAFKLTKLDPQDAWLPITESRNGNKYYAAFHTLCSGIGIQALVIPVAFTILGWTWGIISLTIAFIWQLYTLWLLVHLHESREEGVRYNRYLELCFATFGEKWGKLLALFPILYLSAGTCTTLIIIGGSTARTFYEILPNLNSIAGVSLIGAVTAVGYCTSIWVISVGQGTLPGVSYNPVRGENNVEKTLGVLNAFGIIAFAFRGHNLILEIQATMPSSDKHPSHVPMWKGVKIAYTLIAACLFPVAIAGYWAYGQLIPANGGMLTALYQFHSHDMSRFVLALTSFSVVVNCLCSFQIYSMPIFDDMESKYTKKMNKPCPWWLRTSIRIFSGFVSFFVGVATPFLASLAGLIGGVALPVTLAYPCFMWLKVKSPKKYSVMWCLNWFLGTFGIGLSGLLIGASIYVIIETGVKVSFFNPK